MLKKYRFGFDVAGLVLFLVVMAPTFFWIFVPAPIDVLRDTSATTVIDTVGSVFQFVFIVALCALINKNREKLRPTPLIIMTAVCVILYYLGWVMYYSGMVYHDGMTDPFVIILMTLPPCLAFIFFSIDRKNVIALIPAVGFTVCHLIYGIVNFII